MASTPSTPSTQTTSPFVITVSSPSSAVAVLRGRRRKHRATRASQDAFTKIASMHDTKSGAKAFDRVAAAKLNRPMRFTGQMFFDGASDTVY